MDRWILDELWPEQLPATAVSLLIDGADSPSLSVLASMHAKDDPQEIREVFAKVVSELGLETPERGIALAREVGRIVADVQAGNPDVFEAAAQLSSLSRWFPGTPGSSIDGILAGIAELRRDFAYYGMTNAEAQTEIKRLALELEAALRTDLAFKPSAKPYEAGSLVEFLDHYFHAQWRLDDPDVRSVVRRLASDELDQDLSDVLDDIDKVLDNWRDLRLRNLVVRHLENLSENDRLGQGPPQWLLWLRSQLRPDRAEDFLQARHLVMSRSVPSRGDNLIGMQIDFDAYLSGSDVLGHVDVRRGGSAEELLVARSVVRAGIALEIVAPELEWIWLHELRYRYFQSHTVRQKLDKVRLDFVTQIAVDGFYVTGWIEAKSEGQ